MANLQQGEYGFKKCQFTTTGLGSGGHMTATGLIGDKMELFQPFMQSDVSSGARGYQKIAHHIHPSENKPCYVHEMMMLFPTITPDRYVFTPCEAEHLASDLFNEDGTLKDSRRFYGAGYLDADVTTNATQLTATVEDETDAIFQAGDKLIICRVQYQGTYDATNKALIPPAEGYDWVIAANQYEFVEIASVTYTGAVANITLTTGVTQNFSAEQTEVELAGGTMMPIELTTVASVYTRVNDAANPLYAKVELISGDSAVFDVSQISLNPLSAIDELWTFEFSSATNYTVSGARTGALNTIGGVGSVFQPNNPDYGQPYFTVSDLAWSGSITQGQIFQVKTTPNVMYAMLKRELPSGSAAFNAEEGVALPSVFVG